MKILYLTIGISGTGKSTYVKKHFKPEVVVCPDLIRKEFTGNVNNHTMEPVVWATVKKRLEDSLNKNGEAVLDALNVDAKYRQGVLSPFKSKPDIKTVALLFSPDSETSKKRIAADMKNGVDRSNVPPEAVDKQHKKYLAGYQAIFSQFDEVKEINESSMKLSNLLTEIRLKRK